MRKRIARFIVLFCILLGGFSGQVMAQTREGTISVIQEDMESGKPIAGIKLALYQIAEPSDENDYQLTEMFAASNLKIRDLYDDTKYRENIALLEQYIKEKNPISMQTQMTSADGLVKFENLPDGIYFIKQVNMESDFEEMGFTYKTESYLVELPKIEEDGEKTRDVVCKPKGEIAYPEENKEIIVYKRWQDENDRYGKRPKEIKVGLYAGEKQQEEVSLNAENNWSYKWTDLDSDMDWEIKEEEIPQGYSSKIRKEENVYIITNTYERTKDSVKTGDRSSILFFGSLTVISMMMFSFILYKRNKTYSE